MIPFRDCDQICKDVSGRFNDKTREGLGCKRPDLPLVKIRLKKDLTPIYAGERPIYGATFPTDISDAIVRGMVEPECRGCPSSAVGSAFAASLMKYARFRAEGGIRNQSLFPTDDRLIREAAAYLEGEQERCLRYQNFSIREHNRAQHKR